MKRLGFLVALGLVGLSGGAASAEPVCGQTYTVQAGDSLAKIARFAYRDHHLWAYIYGYGANARVIGARPNRLAVGSRLRLPPCPNPACVATAPARSDGLVARSVMTVDVLTADDDAPFTDQSREDGGMLTEIVSAALTAASGASSFKIVWVNDRAAHIDPLLVQRKFDMGFPWFNPDCDDPEMLAAEDRKLCDFHVSDPLFEVPIVLFKRSDDGRVLASDADLHSLRLCRPVGMLTFDLVRRGLVPGQTVELARPHSAADCFHMLLDGDVDAVTINRLTGENVVRTFGYGAFVETVEMSANVLSLHLIVHRDHPRAAELIAQFNLGLSALKQSGRYDEIVARHLASLREESS